MRLPFEPLDKLCFAATRAPFASCAPTWRLLVHGHLELAWIRAAVASLIKRYPTMASRVVPVGATLERARKLAWEIDDAPDLDRLVRVADLREQDADSRARSEEKLADRVLDLISDYPFALTWVLQPDSNGEERSALYLQQHHALADGRAFLDLIRCFIAALDCASRGTPLPDLGPAVPRLPELAVISSSGFRRFLDTLRGIAATVSLGLGGTLRPSIPLLSNVGTDPTGGDRTVHVLIPEARQELWKSARKPLGISVNDLLTGTLCAALARWSARHGAKPGRTRMVSLVDTRPRDRPFESFANHLGSMILELKLNEATPVLELSAAVAQQTRAQRDRAVPMNRLLSESPLTQAVPLRTIQKTIFDKPKLFASYIFSNLIPLGAPGAGPDGKWRGQGFAVEALQITTPTLPPQGASTTVSRYAGSLSFNFNYKASVLDLKQMNDLGATFLDALAEADAALTRLR